MISSILKFYKIRSSFSTPCEAWTPTGRPRGAWAFDDFFFLLFF